MPGPQKHILFVCSGNTSRSTMAAACFNDLCVRRGLRHIRAEAAGLHSLPGAPIDPEALAALAEKQVLPDRLGSQRLLPKAAHGADLIVAMTTQHRDRVVATFPRLRLKTVTLMAYADRAGDQQLPDPAGGGLDAYRACLARMLPALEALADELAEG